MRRLMLVVFNVLVVSLLLTTSALAAPAPAPSVSAAAPAPALAAARYHWVRAGETLFSIGRLYRVSPWAIASANHLANPNRIYIGQCLYIPPRPVYNPCYYGYYGCYGCCVYRRY